MRSGQRLPDNQAEIVFNDVFIEYLEGRTPAERESVLVDVVSLCDNPAGTHPLSNRSGTDSLAGWNTVAVLNKEHRVVFTSRVVGGVGLIEVLCAGPRKANAAYDLANALIRTGKLTDDEATQIWQALTLLDVVAEEVGLDGWDYRPPSAPEGMIKAVVAANLLEESIARLLAKDELTAAMEGGWTEHGPDPVAALRAAMRRARGSVELADLTRLMVARSEDRCGAVLPRAKTTCIRKAEHPGPHRSAP